MSRRTRPGSIQSAVQQVIVALGGIEASALEAGVSISTLSYGTEQRDDRPGGLGVNHLDRLARIDAAAALPMAQHFATLAGGVFQPIDLSGPSWSDMAGLSREYADVVSVHAAAHSDGSPDPRDYTPAEAAEQIREIDELVSVALRHRASLMIKAEGAA